MNVRMNRSDVYINILSALCFAFTKAGCGFAGSVLCTERIKDVFNKNVCVVSEDKVLLK